MEQIKENKMGTARMFPLIMSMSLPAMFSMLMQSFYNIVDSYFVAKVSEDAFTAVSLAFPVQNLLIAVAVGTAVGLNSLISRRLGEGRREEANAAAAHGIVLGLLSWLVFAVLGALFTRMFFEAFTDSASVISMGCDYTYIVTIVSGGVFVEINMERILQATGNMVYPMIFQLTGCIANIILDPIFIFGLLGVPKMGVAGAAIATVIGQILACLLSLYIGLCKKHEVHITLRGFRMNGRLVRDIYAVGVPSIIMQSIGSFMVAGLNAILISFSNAAVSVFGAYFKLQSFVFMPVFGLTHGVMPILGYNYGAGNRHRLLSGLKIGCMIAIVIMAAGVVPFWVAPGALLRVFEASEEMMTIGVPALRTISLCFIPAALGILFSTLFQAVGMGKNSLFISLLRQLVVLLPCAFVLSKFGLAFVWYAFPAAEVVSLITSVFIMRHIYHTHIKNLVSLRGEAQA